MDNYFVVSSRKEKNRSIIHQVDQGNGNIQIFNYSSIKGGLSWPTAASPAYYCIWGETFLEHIDTRSNNRSRGKLVLFAEKEFVAFSLKEFFLKLTDDTSLYLCEDVYTDLNEEFSGYEESFRNYADKVKIKSGSLQQAPYSDNFLLGLSFIKDWHKSNSLDLPKDSILYRQLKKINVADLEDSPETKFYAINAFRYAIAAFEKYQTSHYIHSLKRRSNPGADSWMGR
ncbi:hypothetical protein ACFL4X_02320 [Gemmatimonadota bacterium]